MPKVKVIFVLWAGGEGGGGGAKWWLRPGSCVIAGSMGSAVGGGQVVKSYRSGIGGRSSFVVLIRCGWRRRLAHRWRCCRWCRNLDVGAVLLEIAGVLRLSRAGSQRLNRWSFFRAVIIFYLGSPMIPPTYSTILEFENDFYFYVAIRKVEFSFAEFVGARHAEHGDSLAERSPPEGQRKKKENNSVARSSPRHTREPTRSLGFARRGQLIILDVLRIASWILGTSVPPLKKGPSTRGLQTVPHSKTGTRALLGPCASEFRRCALRRRRRSRRRCCYTLSAACTRSALVRS